MGQESLYRCKTCGREFISREGGGISFDLYRCVNCDWIKEVSNGRRMWGDEYKQPSAQDIGRCRKCGGELRDDLQPMCRNCGSRNVEEKEVRILYD